MRGVKALAYRVGYTDKFLSYNSGGVLCPGEDMGNPEAIFCVVQL
jgi:hypothetical protein